MKNGLSSLDTALALLRRELWPVPLHPFGASIPTKYGSKIATGKEPIGNAWGKTRPTDAALRRNFERTPGAGVGVLLGPVGGVVDIEVDGPEGEASLVKLFGGEVVATMGWSSRRGPHHLFRYDPRMSIIDPKRRARFTLPNLPGLEFRFGQGKQAQSAVPPTIGQDGEPRLWNDCDTIAPLPEYAFRFLTDALAEGCGEPRNEAPQVATLPTEPSAAWFRKALTNEAGKVATAAEGTRHDTLLAAARTLGGMLHHGYLNESDVIAELTRAGRRSGLPDDEVDKTIRDGLSNGKAAPLPWPVNLKPPKDSSRNGRHAADPAQTAPQGVLKTDETQAQALLRLASVAELTRTEDGRFFAHVPVGEHHENHEVRSPGFKRWLTREFYREQVRPPSSEAMQGALGVLETQAQFDGAIKPVFVRVAPADNGGVYLDLGDDSWCATHVNPNGWELFALPPVRFRRPKGMCQLPTPELGGSMRELRRFVNVDETDFLLLIAWLTAALLPDGPYPILVLTGEQGSAKSTLALLLRLLIDPHASPLRSEPKEARDLMVSAVNEWVIALDNLSHVPPWLSDALCRLATGGGFATRQLYSDSEEVFLDAQRPTILTGIEDFVRRGDLADRCVFLHLPTIPETDRRTEAEFWEGFESVRARIFGAVLDAIAGGLRQLPEIKLTRMPRMADFAKWGEAVCQALGEKPGAFLAAYQQNRRDANEAALEDSPVAAAVREFMANRLEWVGISGELLEELNRLVPDHATLKERWPK